MGKRYAATVIKITLRLKILVGSVERINLIIVTRCRCGGAVERKVKTHPDVSFLSMIVKMMKTLMTLKRRKNRCKDN